VRLVTITSTLPPELRPERDILFLTTHGSFGEDGSLQAKLDAAGFVYTGADASASHLAFQKTLTKKLAGHLGFPTPEGIAFNSRPDAAALWAALGPRIVLKPEAQGSSVGLYICSTLDELTAALDKIYSDAPKAATDQTSLAGLGGTYLAEKFIEGRELTCGFLNGAALAVVEIIPTGGVYDYTNKYTAGRTRYEFPAKLSPEISAQVQSTTARICTAAGMRDFARVDFRLSPDGTPYFLEINTLPGMTATSLLPKSASPMGYDFSQLCSAMLAGARARFADRYAMKFATV
jgi:D-alanine-D-alanine ligase